jgi:transcription-repair coupling factor (superfamily II helicase)
MPAGTLPWAAASNAAVPLKIAQYSTMQSICKRLLESRQRLNLCGLHGGSAALFAARLQAEQGGSLCCIVPLDEFLEPLAEDIGLFTAVPVVTYPAFEIAPYAQLAPDPATVATRLATLHCLQEHSEPCIVLASAEAILRRIMPRQVLADHCELVMTGEETDRDELIASLSMAGYQICEQVQHPGDMAVRGGIVDLYTPAFRPDIQGPLRLDFFGDTVESIRTFDPLSQRSLTELEEAILLPASDILFPKPDQEGRHWQPDPDTLTELGVDRDQAGAVLEQLREQVRFPGIEFLLPLIYRKPAPQTLFDYLPRDTPCLLHDPVAIRRKVDLVWERILANHQEAAPEGVAPTPASLFLDRQELESCLQRHVRVDLYTLPDPDAPQPPVMLQVGEHSLLKQEIDLERKKRGLLAPLADRLLNWQQAGDTIMLACRSARQAGHFEEILAGYQIRTARTTAPLDLAPRPGEMLLVEHPLSHGFDLPDEQLHVLSAAELFGEKRLRSSGHKKGRRAGGEPVAVEKLAIGDIVVHRDHGLASFQGLVNMEFAGQRGDFMQLEFRDEDKLYIPVDQLHWVSRYQGLTDQQPRLDRLGSERWQSTKKKVTEAVWQVAQELLDIYARRELRTGHRFQPPGPLYRELEESFPYDETEGQARAIEEVLEDLTTDQPMDRLVCGDVGYGKTEVAVRAAFKAIEDGFQVAVLVPTTVLAEQHAATFRERFSEFPVEVACINRFRSTGQQKEIIRKLAAGHIDLVVGTHRLLSKDIVINKLGLLIVDEEHRFGVTHKEKIKKLRATVDVLTLTATPIPRTLQMSLLGIRDLSVISTPPRRRRSVKTFLARHDDLMIREAVLQELARGGQVFFVHNRVKSIHRIAEKIEKLVPHARIAVGHGQMPGKNLEDIMVSFINHEIDILVCTTIIESGLDIPNANTIIINRADHLGLADIYQLRGRVGRSSRQSYAYLLVPSLDRLTKDAGQRLRALMDCSELGGGFKLAMNDLQIRGGGNLLGVSQSGHIAAVGYDLYLELLQSTVAELKKKAAGAASREPELDPEIKLRIAAFLPDDYVRDTAQRYQLYRRISTAANQDPEILADLRDELIDRFGPLPPEADTLFTMIGLKYPLRKLGISKLEQGPTNLVFTFVDSSPVEPAAFLELISQHSPKKKKGTVHPVADPIRLTPDHRLIVAIDEKENLFTRIDTVLHFLAKE